MDAARVAEIVQAFERQAGASQGLGSPVYGDLLARLAADISAGGPAADLLSGWQGEPRKEALALRLMAAVHAEVLAERAPALARYYDSMGGSYDSVPAWEALRDLLVSAGPRLSRRLDQQVQTNEVRRSAILLGGFNRIAQTTGLPLSLYELGSSAGLNLHWDKFRYDVGTQSYGSAESDVHLSSAWRGKIPDLLADIAIANRAGCDRFPIDVRDAEPRERLRSFIWPDQPERLALLDAAIAIMRNDPVQLTAASAADWLQDRIDKPQPGAVRVLFHSVVWWYIPEAERSRIERLMETAGKLATSEAPLAWLRMELGTLDYADIRLRIWPDGVDEHLARAHWHGQWVEWLA
jgi:hypothetical protein